MKKEVEGRGGGRRGGRRRWRKKRREGGEGKGMKKEVEEKK